MVDVAGIVATMLELSALDHTFTIDAADSQLLFVAARKLIATLLYLLVSTVNSKYGRVLET